MWNGVTIEFSLIKLHTALLSLYCPFSPSPRPAASPTVRSHHPPNPSSNTPPPLSRQCPCNGYLKFFNLVDYFCFATIITMCQPLIPPALSYRSFFNTPLSYRLFYLPLPKSSFKTLRSGLIASSYIQNSVLLIIEIYNIHFSRQLIER